MTDLMRAGLLGVATLAMVGAVIFVVAALRAPQADTRRIRAEAKRDRSKTIEERGKQTNQGFVPPVAASSDEEMH